jgi:beta-lactamase class A
MSIPAFLAAGSASASRIERQLAARVAAFDGVVGLFAKNLDNGETVAVAGDTRFPAASLIKVAVMAEVFRQIAARQLEPSAPVTLRDADKAGDEITPLALLHDGTMLTIADLLRAMVAYSDNTATNLLLRRVGIHGVNALLDSLELRQTRLYRPTFRDGRADVLPEEEREYGLGSTTPREAALLLEAIVEGRIGSRAHGEAMVDLLAEQQDRAMIPRSLPFERDAIRVAHKTGWDEEKLADEHGFRGGVRNDAAYIEFPGGRYVLSICARRIRDRSASVDNAALRAGAELSRLVYVHFRSRRAEPEPPS